MSEFVYQDGKLIQKFERNIEYIKTSANSFLTPQITSNWQSHYKEYVFSIEQVESILKEIVETPSIVIDKFKSLEIELKIKDREEVKSFFNIGDKVKIITTNYKLVSNENINLKGFTGLVTNIICNCRETTFFIYHVDINGLEFSFWQSDLKLIEKSKTIEYKKNLLNVADDIDGCLLPNSKKFIELIQGS